MKMMTDHSTYMAQMAAEHAACALVDLLRFKREGALDQHSAAFDDLTLGQLARALELAMALEMQEVMHSTNDDQRRRSMSAMGQMQGAIDRFHEEYPHV